MIEVNFLPLEVKKSKALPKIPSGLPLKIFCTILAVLISIHVVLLLVFFGQKFYLSRLTSKVSERSPQTAEAASIKEKIKVLEQEQSISEQLFGKRIIWAEKLNILSDELPNGVWLSRLVVTDKLFSLQGTAVSLKSEEMKMIGLFLDSLKNNKNFYNDFEDLALKSIQRRNLKSTEVVDFIIAGILKQ